MGWGRPPVGEKLLFFANLLKGARGLSRNLRITAFGGFTKVFRGS